MTLVTFYLLLVSFPLQVSKGRMHVCLAQCVAFKPHYSPQIVSVTGGHVLISDIVQETHTHSQWVCVCVRVYLYNSTSWLSCKEVEEFCHISCMSKHFSHEVRLYELTGSVFTHKLTPKRCYIDNITCLSGNTWSAFQRPQLFPLGKESSLVYCRYEISRWDS